MNARAKVATKAARALAVGIRKGARVDAPDVRALFLDVATALERLADALDGGGQS